MQAHPLTADEQDTIDRLIPPPWSAGRRTLAWAAIAVLVVGFGYFWTNAWLAPNLEIAAGEWGGSGPVTTGIHVTNNGGRSVRIDAAGAADGLRQISVTASDQPLPFILHPGATTFLLATYEVADCSAIDTADFDFPIEVEFTGSVLTRPQTLQIDLRGMVSDDRVGNADDSAWPASTTQYVCP